jgi:hypothetical protein
MTRQAKCELAIEKGFYYNDLSGIITTPKGIETKRVTVNGYIHLALWSDNKRYDLLGHQFAWYVNNKETIPCIDHVNGIKTDNRIANLRSVTKSQNAMNMKNVRGYTFCNRSKKYIAIIMVNYKKKQLGIFKTPEEARQCYLDNKNKYHIFNN